MKLCKDCKFYKEGEMENKDVCMHQRASYGGVREYSQYPCFAMRIGICGKEAALFVPNERNWQDAIE
jgi:hypothetical protein